MSRQRADEIARKMRLEVQTAWDRGSRKLPTTRRLAARFGCALATVVKALGQLADEGCVAPVPRRGTSILRRPPDTPPKAAQAPPLTPRRRLVQRMLRDISDGRLSHSPSSDLPPMKQLATRYGVGRVLLRSAMAELTSAGYLTRTGRRFSLPASAQRPSLTLHLVALGDNQGLMGQQTPHQLPLLEQLEQECHNRAISFRAHILPRGFGSPEIPKSIAADIRRAAGDDTTAGFIVWHQYVTPFLFRQLRAIIGARCSVALLDDSGDLEESTRRSLPSTWRVFSVTQSPRCGRITGRCLIERGHRHIAYLTAWPQARWSVNRQAGLHQACCDSSGLASLQIFSPVHSAPPRIQTRADERVYDHLSSTIEALSFTPRSDSLPFSLLRDATVNVLHRFESHQSRQLTMAPLMARALDAERITAWVCANDALAEVCLSFLRQARRRIPEDMSLVSFDDTQTAVRYHLSSYNFNPYALASSMISAVLDPDRFARAHPEPVVEIDGFVRERRTVASPPART